MMLTMSSGIVLGLAVLAIVLANTCDGLAKRKMGGKAHCVICASALLLGCFVRLFRLGSLPAGLSAEEALVGVQAKALWQTGGFLFDGGLTTQLAQWTGESTGPLLATLTAPFVGVLGMTAWAVRLPLALLSCAAIPAAYGVGRLLGGKRAARWCMIAYALCPYFVLTARLTCGANAAVCLLPIAVYAMLRGMKTPGWLYVGAVLMGLTAYAQNMYFFIAPAAILCGCAMAALGGMKKRHALCAAALGVLVCMPAMLTLWVNLNDLEGFTWLGVVQIPRLEGFDKADSLMDSFVEGRTYQVRNKIWMVITGAVFQVMAHMNISAEMFAPSGMCALYVISIPLMLLGAFSLVHRILRGEKFGRDRVVGGVYMALLAAITLFWLVMYGSVGLLDTTGCTSAFDYSAMLLFDVLLMAAGLCWMEKKSSAGTGALGGLFAACFVMLCIHLYGNGYRDNANVYFDGFGELAAKADAIQEETDAKVNVTGTVYPHISPSDAAEIMYLYAVNADMREIDTQRGKSYEVIYAPGVEHPDTEQIYFVAQSDIVEWDLTGFAYEEAGEYVLLTPAGE